MGWLCTHLADRRPVAIEAAAMRSTPATEQLMLPYLVMPSHHDVRASNVIARRLHGNLAAAADRGLKDFSEFLLTRAAQKLITK